MSRLIDADKLIEDLKESYDECEIQTMLEYFGIYEFIKEQPTAFDVDKVVKQLDLLREKAQKRREEFIELNSYNNVIIKNIEYERGRVYAFDDAIEVVKEGGIDE